MERKSLKTERMEMSYLYAGEEGKPRLVLVHGNTSSSLFFVEIIEKLEDRYEIIAPDLRCFGESEAVPIDATRGLKDHSDDLYALLQALGWEKFFLLGWSMGGGVVMEYAIAHPEQVEGLILEAPLWDRRDLRSRRQKAGTAWDRNGCRRNHPGKNGLAYRSGQGRRSRTAFRELYISRV